MGNHYDHSYGGEMLQIATLCDNEETSFCNVDQDMHIGPIKIPWKAKLFIYLAGINRKADQNQMRLIKFKTCKRIN